MNPRPRAVLGMSPEWVNPLFSDGALDRLGTLVRIDTEPLSEAADTLNRVDLDDVEIMVGFWGAPVMSTELLDMMPKLKALVYAAGSVKHLVTKELLSRNIRVSSAAQINAQPVAEYTVAMVILALKRVFEIERSYRRDGWSPVSPAPQNITGVFGKTVGVVGASHIGKKVIELLKPFDVDVLLSDPYTEIVDSGVQQVSFDELIERSDVVTLHCPLTEETQGMVNASVLSRIRTGATLINTARGGLIDMPALVEALSSGRIRAILDVTDPVEPLPASHPLLMLDNVTVTPHIAGSFGSETRRLGDFAIREIARYLDGDTMHGEIDPRLLTRQA